MIKLIVAIFAILFSTTAFSQTTSALNLDFETSENGLPSNWKQYGSENYNVSVDSNHVKNGHYSASLEFTGKAADFTTISFVLPDNYKGKKITLSGYLKTENVVDGYAGLMIRIDPGVAFGDMYRENIKGTTDWTKYELTVYMDPEKTDKIVVGAALFGEGKMWVDQLEVTVDGKDIHEAKIYHRELFPAEEDNEFDAGSTITDFTPDQQQINNLETLGRIWGFLKYYHPAVATGEYNWDYELFRILPDIIDAKTQNERDDILVTWIDSYGELPKEKKPKFKASEVKMAADLDWIERSGFSEDLVEKLLAVRNAKRSDEHFYIGLNQYVGSPEFKNERSYASMNYPDAGFRLLSLYRYWNIIQYYFPYKNLIEEDWQDVLTEFVPKFLGAENETAYVLSCLEIIGRIHDAHANIAGWIDVLDNYWGKRYTALDIRFVEEKAVVTAYHEEAKGKETGLIVGDVITSINGKAVDAIVQEQLYLTPASNYPTKLRNIARQLLRTNEATMELEFLRDGTVNNVTVNTYAKNDIHLNSYYDNMDTSFRMIDDDIAYINHGSLQIDHLPEIWEKIEGTKGLIIDDRNYPSDFPIDQFSALLMPKKMPFVKFSKGSVTHPGYFTFTKPSFVGKRKNNNYYKGKVIILVNEVSQSSSEFHAMGYRVHPNALVIGSTTAGADGDISRFTLPGNIPTAISGIGVYYPNGEETQRIGIVPDIECKPTIQGIKEGRDEVLEKALETIRTDQH